jgi:hypothetical protein
MKNQLIKFSDVPNPYEIPPGSILEVVGGDVAAPLRAYCQKYDGPAPHPLKQINMREFEAEEQRRKEREQTPIVKPKALSAKDVCREFGWDTDTLAKAQAKFGFPMPRILTMSWRGQTAAYAEREVSRWAEDLRAFVRATRLGK